MDLLSALATHSLHTYQTIDTFFQEQEHEAASIDRYVQQSVKLLQEFTMRGGKAIRPFLGQLAYDLAGGKKNNGLSKALASIELHHKHILILDDISDRDETRYGGPTLEYRYHDVFANLPDSEHKSKSFAMMDASLLGGFAKELLMESAFPATTILKTLHILDTTMFRDTLAGWQIHGMQCVEPIAKATKEEFIKGLRLVTASYTFEGPLQIGLVLAGNKNKKLESALVTYATQVGTAFQIHDDILGLFGDPKVTGKPVGNDVREGKKTLLLQVAYERASSDEKAVLEKACGKPISTDTLKRVQKIVTDSGSLEYSKRLEKEYVERGLAALENLPKSNAKQHLTDLAFYIITRDK